MRFPYISLTFLCGVIFLSFTIHYPLSTGFCDLCGSKTPIFVFLSQLLLPTADIYPLLLNTLNNNFLFLIVLCSLIFLSFYLSIFPSFYLSIFPSFHLSIFYNPLSTTYYLLLTVHYLLSTIYYLLLTTHCSLSTFYFLLHLSAPQLSYHLIFRQKKR